MPSTDESVRFTNTCFIEIVAMQLSTLASMCWLLKCKAALLFVKKFISLLFMTPSHCAQGHVFALVDDWVDCIQISFKIMIISLSLKSLIYHNLL